jgi:hypothetical protein
LDGFWLVSDDEQVGARGAIGVSAPLFPLLQSSQADAVAAGEFGLRKAGVLTQIRSYEEASGAPGWRRERC